MCTAISFLSNHHFFGRNLDLEYHYSESVTITPRKFQFQLRVGETISQHFAIIGIATVIEGYPLYYDASNEHGLSIAALNFPGNAVYNNIDHTKINITPFELIPYILGKYRNVEETVHGLQSINIVNIPFNKELPLTPLHWFICDKKRAITVEQTKDGMQIYDNPYRVLTNNPPFPYHMHNICNYLNLSPKEPENHFATIPAKPYSRGMGAFGLPGDLSSASRFVRAAFVLHNSVCESSEYGLSQFFHILGSVEQQKGCVHIGKHLEKTIYTSCCDTDEGIYYYATYENHQITGVDMNRHDLDGYELFSYPLRFKQQLCWESK